MGQVQVLDAVYAGDAANRCPYVLLVASALAPKPARAAALMRSAGLAALPGAAQELAQVYTRGRSWRRYILGAN